MKEIGNAILPNCRTQNGFETACFDYSIVLMNRETRLNDTPLFNLLVNVLSYYPCPSDCPSLCCKLINIDMDKHDFRILTKAGKIKIGKFELIKQDGTLYYSTQPPCQFLSDINKCSALIEGQLSVECFHFSFLLLKPQLVFTHVNWA